MRIITQKRYGNGEDVSFGYSINLLTDSCDKTVTIEDKTEAPMKRIRKFQVYGLKELLYEAYYAGKRGEGLYYEESESWTLE